MKNTIPQVMLHYTAEQSVVEQFTSFLNAAAETQGKSLVLSTEDLKGGGVKNTQSFGFGPSCEGPDNDNVDLLKYETITYEGRDELPPEARLTLSLDNESLGNKASLQQMMIYLQGEDDIFRQHGLQRAANFKTDMTKTKSLQALLAPYIAFKPV